MKGSKRKLQLSYSKFITLYIALVMASNIVFWQKIISHNAEANIYPITFVVTIFAVLYIFFSVFCVKYVTKLFCIVIFLLNSYAIYLMQMYNISSLNSDIIHKLPFKYLHWKIIIYLPLLGLLPSFLVYKVRILYHNTTKEILMRSIVSIILMIFSATLICIQYKKIYNIHTILEKNYKYLVPVNYITEIYKIQKI